MMTGIKNILYGWMATLMLGCCALFVVSCSSDDPEPEPEQKQEQGDLLQVVSCTRSDDALIESGSKIKMFITTDDGDAPEEAIFERTARNSDPFWTTGGKIKENVDYYLYGMLFGDKITPSINITPSISPGGYSSGATLTVNDLSPLALEGQDPCVIVGVKGTTDNNVTLGENDVERGKFGYKGRAKEHNYVHLLLDRLYSAVSFDFGPLDSEYASLRTIKLTKLELKVNSSAWSNLNLSIQLKANDEGNPVETITASQSGTTDLEPIILFECAAGKEFSEIQDGEIKVCCFEPSVARYLSIVSQYDVYDKGDPSRNIEPYKLSSRTAENALGGILTYTDPQTNTQLPTLTRGEKLTLTLTVNPTYLYQLSDPDATIVTIKKP